jgi:nucleoside-diphosphate-sugar epimerase
MATAAMTTIAVLGATGGTGREVVQQALAAGQSVRALVRTPEKLNLKHERLSVVRGDAHNADDVAAVRTARQQHAPPLCVRVCLSVCLSAFVRACVYLPVCMGTRRLVSAWVGMRAAC